MDTFDWHMLLTSGATCRMSLRACLRTATVRAPFGSQVTGYGKPQLNLSSFYSDCSLGVWLSVHRFNHRPNQWSGQDGGLWRTWVTPAPSHILEQWKLENYHLPLPVHTPFTGTVFHSHWKILTPLYFQNSVELAAETSLRIWVEKYNWHVYGSWKQEKLHQEPWIHMPLKQR